MAAIDDSFDQVNTFILAFVITEIIPEQIFLSGVSVTAFKFGSFETFKT